MTAIWTQDPPYNLKGKYWDCTVADFVIPEYGVGYMGKPYQKPHPPIALALRSPQSGGTLLCAARGWIPISGNFIPTAFVKGHWEGYAAACEKAGRKPDRHIWRVARSILVTRDEAEGRDYNADPEGGMSFYFRYLRTLAMMRTTPASTIGSAPRAVMRSGERRPSPQKRGRSPISPEKCEIGLRPLF